MAQVAAEIGVGAQLLGRWVKLSQPAGGEADEALDVSERAEQERLRKRTPT